MSRPGVLTVLVAVLLAVAGCAADDARPRAGTASDGRPAAPEGMRLLGTDGIVIAVPDDWVQAADDPCLVAVPDRSYVLHESPVHPSDLAQLAEECRRSGAYDGGTSAISADESLTVSVGRQYFAVLKGADDPDPTPTPLVRGDLDVEAWVDCDDLGGDVGTVYCAATWRIQDEDLSFSVRVPGDGGRALLTAMDRSIRRLPDGWTTSDTDGTVVRDEG